MLLPPTHCVNAATALLSVQACLASPPERPSPGRASPHPFETAPGNSSLPVMDFRRTCSCCFMAWGTRPLHLPAWHGRCGCRRWVECGPAGHRGMQHYHALPCITIHYHALPYKLDQTALILAQRMAYSADLLLFQ